MTDNSQAAPYHFISAEERTEGFTHVLLVATGSVASIKAPLIVAELLKVCPVALRLAVALKV